MQSLKTIRLVYLVYTVYTFFVISVSDYNPWIAFVGLISIWSIYLAYAFGYISAEKRNRKTEEDENNEEWDERFLFYNIQNWKSWQYCFAALVSWVCSVLAARFYTSRGFISVLLGAFQGEQAYSIYQHYVIEANIGAFTISKIPYILMLVYCTVMLFWSMLGLLCSGRKMRIGQTVFVISIIASYLYFGLARGTNFEMYIVFVILVYCLLNRPGRTIVDKRKRRRAIVIIAILAVVVIIIFRSVVAARGNVFRNQICTEIHYSETKFISKMFPTITNMGLSVFRYFGFGIFTIGMAIDKIVFASIPGMLAFNIPFGYELIMNTDLMSLVRQTVDIGVGWVPDYISFVNTFGLPLALVVFYFFGTICGRLYASRRTVLLKNLVGAVMFLEMLSIPVGNFIATSTPNELTILLIVVWYLKGKLRISLGGKRLA